MANAQLSNQDYQSAMNSFTKSEDIANKALSQGDWANPLLLQSRLGKGATAVSAKNWSLGAKIYSEQALPITKKIKDKKMEIDCLRMAAYCHEQNRDIDSCWNNLVDALKIGKEIPNTERTSTTLPFVGQSLLKITNDYKNYKYQSYQAGIEKEMNNLLGNNWKDMCKEQTPPSPKIETETPIKTQLA